MKRLLAMVWALARPVPTPPEPKVERIATKTYQTRDGTAPIATHVVCFMQVNGERASTVDTTHEGLANLHQDLLEDRAAWAYHADMPADCRRLGEPRKAASAAVVPLRPATKLVSPPTGGDAA